MPSYQGVSPIFAKSVITITGLYVQSILADIINVWFGLWIVGVKQNKIEVIRSWWHLFSQEERFFDLAKLLTALCVCCSDYKPDLTFMFLPPIMTPFICSKASWAASGSSYSMKAKPLCFTVIGSQDRSTDLIGPNGIKACLTVSSLISKFILPT